MGYNEAQWSSARSLTISLSILASLALAVPAQGTGDPPGEG